MLLLRTTLLSLLALIAARETAAADDPPITGNLGIAATGSDEAFGIALDARLVLRRGTMLGVGLTLGDVDTAYFGGRTIHGAASVETTALALVPVVRSGPLALDFRMASGVRFTRDLGTRASQYGDALRSVTDFGLFAHVRVRERVLLRLGVICVVELELRPTVALADQMQLLSFGVGIAVTPHALLYVNTETGGTYGFDGNNGKVVLRGALGLRIPLGGDARSSF